MNDEDLGDASKRRHLHLFCGQKGVFWGAGGSGSQAVLWIALVLELFCLFNTVRGIVLSLQGKAKGIPFIGWITVVPYRLLGQ